MTMVAAADFRQDAPAQTVQGMILHSQRFSTEDGPGLRTTFFLKGCPLSCEWCHNPESIARSPQIQWLENRCIHCGTCLRTCPQGAYTWEGNDLRRDAGRCELCGACVEECPGAGLEMLGKLTTPDELVAEAVKDRAYYASSGGGVTLSGGEPTLQPTFALRTLQSLKSAGIATALDTCGLCSPHTLEDLLPFTDLVLYDLKFMDAAEHLRHTGQSNEVILRNLQVARDHVSAPRVWVRTPLIPGATATAENITAIGEFLRTQMNGRVERWELCAFNNLCRDKYRRLGLDWRYAETPLMAQAELDEIGRLARAAFEPEKAIVTGAGRKG